MANHSVNKFGQPRFQGLFPTKGQALGNLARRQLPNKNEENDSGTFYMKGL